MNTGNSKMNEPHRFKLDLTDKLNVKDPKKNMALADLNIYYTWKDIKSEYKNNKFKFSAPTWNDTFDLPDGSNSIADIQEFFEFIIKKHETLTKNPPVQIYPNKINNRIVCFLIKIKMEKMYQSQNLLRLSSQKRSSTHIESFIHFCSKQSLGN